YSKQNKYPDALKIYEEVLSFDKNKPEVYIYLGATYMQIKEYAKAERIFKDGLKLFPDNVDLLFNSAVLFEKTGRFDDMVTVLKRSIELDPKNAEALNYLGYSYADKGVNLKEALSLVQRAVELKPDSGYIVDSLGWVYFKMGRLEEALQALKQAVNLVKDDPVLNEHLGDVYKAMGKNADALNAWNTSLRFESKEEGLKERVEAKIRKFQNKKDTH